MTDLLQFLNSPPDEPREPHASHSIPKPLKEVPVSTGVDRLMKRPDVDPDRIARMGLSMDGISGSPDGGLRASSLCLHRLWRHS